MMDPVGQGWNLSAFWGSLEYPGEEFVPVTYFSTSVWLFTEGIGPDLPARRPTQLVVWVLTMRYLVIPRQAPVV